jgi:exodeoxyribonuclease VIII
MQPQDMVQLVKTYPYIFSDMDIGTYHSCAGLSRSSLMVFKRSPLHYWHYYLNPLFKKSWPTREMIFGNAVHTWILEPHTFHDRYRCYEKKERRTKKGKEYYEAESLAAAATNRILLTMDECEQIKAIGYAIDGNDMASSMVASGKKEHSLFWKDINTDILCKARPDIWSSDLGFIADLKTTNDASPNAFKHDIYRYGYHLQCAFMSEATLACTGDRIFDFIFIAIEKEPPYAIGIYQLGGDLLNEGLTLFHDLLDKLKECQLNNKWPSYDTGVT